MFAGHSLGEYTAVSAIGQVMPFEKLLSVTFLRALIMDSAVTRCSQGRSEFGMVAINPSRISHHADTEYLQQLTEKISTTTGELLEVVNYNIEMQQYVATGSLRALSCLRNVTDQLARRAAQELDVLDEVVLDALIATTAAHTTTNIKTERGVATVPLQGIDVPFHSTFLLSKMPAFRCVLERYIGNVDATRLVGRWVTNVTGKPFDISKEGINEVYKRTQSQVLKELLESEAQRW